MQISKNDQWYKFANKWATTSLDNCKYWSDSYDNDRRRHYVIDLCKFVRTCIIAIFFCSLIWFFGLYAILGVITSILVAFDVSSFGQFIEIIGRNNLIGGFLAGATCTMLLILTFGFALVIVGAAFFILESIKKFSKNKEPSLVSAYIKSKKEKYCLRVDLVE